MPKLFIYINNNNIIEKKDYNIVLLNYKNIIYYHLFNKSMYKTKYIKNNDQVYIPFGIKLIIKNNTHNVQQ